MHHPLREEAHYGLVEADQAEEGVARGQDLRGGGLRASQGNGALLAAANTDNWEAMAGLASEYRAPLVVRGQSGDLDGLITLAEQVMRDPRYIQIGRAGGPATTISHEPPCAPAAMSQKLVAGHWASDVHS